MGPYTEITSRDNERVKAACVLRDKAAQRAENGLFFAEGVRLCLDLAAALRPCRAFFTQRVLEKYPKVAGLAEEGFLVMDHVAEKLAGTKNPQGLVCLFPMPAGGWQALVPHNGLLVCEAIQDPGNIGAVLRSAAAFGFGGAVLTEGCADPFSPKVLRASVGASARLPLVTGVATVQAARALRDMGAHQWAAALQSAQPLTGVQPKAPFALWIGNEGAGLSGEALRETDEAVYIPMQGGVESLNAAVAASVLMYHFSQGVL